MRDFIFTGFEENPNFSNKIVIGGTEYTGHWVEGSLIEKSIKDEPMASFIYNWYQKAFFRVLSETVSEYTQTEDMDGKPLYENQKVKFKGKIYTISFNEINLKFECVNEEGEEIDLFANQHEMELIGFVIDKEKI